MQSSAVALLCLLLFDPHTEKYGADATVDQQFVITARTWHAPALRTGCEGAPQRPRARQGEGGWRVRSPASRRASAGHTATARRPTFCSAAGSAMSATVGKPCASSR